MNSRLVAYHGQDGIAGQDLVAASSAARRVLTVATHRVLGVRINRHGIYCKIVIMSNSTKSETQDTEIKALEMYSDTYQ